jgi:hypothetical protein
MKNSIPLHLAIKELNKAPNIASQSKVLLDLNEYFRTHEVSQQELVGCWSTVKPFLNGQLAPEVYDWITACLKFHFEDCDVLRLDFFNVCSGGGPERILARLNLLKALTLDGKDLRHFEHDIGGLLGKWVKYSVGTGAEDVHIELLKFMTNLIKVSFIYLDETEIVNMLDAIHQSSSSSGMTINCLEFLDAICRYGSIPPTSLNAFVYMLCIGMETQHGRVLASVIFGNLQKSHLSGRSRRCINNVFYDKHADLALQLGAVDLMNEILKDSKSGLSIAARVVCD